MSGFSAVTYALTKKYVNKKIADITILKIKIVNELPSSGEPNTLYFLKTSTQATNLYSEYIWVQEGGGFWEKLGDISINLDNYYTKDEIDKMFLASGEQVDQKIEDAIKNIQLPHSITIGGLIFDGTQNIVIPTYEGEIIPEYAGKYFLLREGD